MATIGKYKKPLRVQNTFYGYYVTHKGKRVRKETLNDAKALVKRIASPKWRGR